MASARPERRRRDRARISIQINAPETSAVAAQREKNQRMTGRIVKPQKLGERREESQTAGGGDRCRPIAAKRGAGGNLAANGEDVAQGLVEIAHLI